MRASKTYLRNALIIGLLLAASTLPLPAFAAPPAPAAPPAECYCAECGMYVKGEGVRFASQMVMRDGKRQFFCDLGDLFVHYEVSKKKKDIAAIYVKDHASGAWLDARKARYLAGTKVKTPMRYGIIAFRDKASAEAFRKANGGKDIYTFDEVLASKVYRR